MEKIQNNMQKYSNYKEQMGRLRKAMASGFYLEAVFIEYAIIEDRLESIIRHSGTWKEAFDEDPPTITRKLGIVDELARRKKSLPQKYFKPELTTAIKEWKDHRNKIIHALLKQDLHTEQLKAIAAEGEMLAKTLSNKVTSYKRALERAQG